MRMPSHTALCSFIFSTILTSALVPSSGNVALASAGAPAVQMAVQAALNGMRAQGFAGSTELALPATAASPASAPAAVVAVPGTALTPEVLSKMLQAIALKGSDSYVSAPIANGLGLTAAGQTWLNHKIAFNGTDAFIHGFTVSRGSDEDLVIYVRHPDSTHIFRAHRDGTIVTALNFDTQTQAITMRAPAEARPELEVELKFWAAGIDSILSGK